MKERLLTTEEAKFLKWREGEISAVCQAQDAKTLQAIGERLEELLYQPKVTKESGGVYNVSWQVDKGVLYDAIARLRRGESP